MAYVQKFEPYRFYIIVTTMQGYPTFGLAMLDEAGRCVSLIEDLSLDRVYVSKLKSLCTLWQLDPLHLQDLAEDFLT